MEGIIISPFAVTGLRKIVVALTTVPGRAPVKLTDAEPADQFHIILFALTVLSVLK